MKAEKEFQLSQNEYIMNGITATLEVNEPAGIMYRFGEVIATNKRLIFYTKYPLLGLRESAIYHYKDVTQVDTARASVSFNNRATFAVKLVNRGSPKLLLKVIKLFSNQALRDV